MDWRDGADCTGSTGLGRERRLADEGGERDSVPAYRDDDALQEGARRLDAKPVSLPQYLLNLHNGESQVFAEREGSLCPRHVTP